jgi:hypothetical protein
MLIPFVGAFWITIQTANFCVKKGIRLVGIFSSLALGGFCTMLGYWGAFVGYEETRTNGIYQVTFPVWGWIGLVGGAVIALFGIWTSLAGNKEEIELREEAENIEQQRQMEDNLQQHEKQREEHSREVVIESINKWIEKDKIDSKEWLMWVSDFIEKRPFDTELKTLFDQLKPLITKSRLK